MASTAMRVLPSVPFLNRPGRRALRPSHGGSGFLWCAPRWPPADEIGDKLTGHHIEKLGGRRYPQLINLQQQAPRQLNSVVDPVAAVEVGIGD